jgi:hypothetical protein
MCEFANIYIYMEIYQKDLDKINQITLRKIVNDIGQSKVKRDTYHFWLLINGAIFQKNITMVIC